eukprot:777391_1
MKLTTYTLGILGVTACEGRNLRAANTFPLDATSATITPTETHYCTCGMNGSCYCSDSTKNPNVRGPSDFTWRNMAMNHNDDTEDFIMFSSPTHHGKLVDYCLEFDPQEDPGDPQDCGQPAADLYCYEKNFGPAVDYAK